MANFVDQNGVTNFVDLARGQSRKCCAADVEAPQRHEGDEGTNLLNKTIVHWYPNSATAFDQGARDRGRAEGDPCWRGEKACPRFYRRAGQWSPFHRADINGPVKFERWVRRARLSRAHW